MITHYTIIENTRSKYPTLRITAHDGLVVVVPPRYKKEKIPTMLSKKKAWIEENMAKWHTFRLENEIEESFEKPNSITLQSIQKKWDIQYTESGAAFREEEGKITLNLLAWHANLEKWLHRQAREVFSQQLENLSQETGLSYTGISIRNQKSRWGSCSSKGRIQLNIKLLFLPPELVRNVMIHELCHTQHMNHGAQFWQLVEKYDPHYKKHNHALKESMAHIPRWLSCSPQSEKRSIDL